VAASVWRFPRRPRLLPSPTQGDAPASRGFAGASSSWLGGVARPAVLCRQDVREACHERVSPRPVQRRNRMRPVGTPAWVNGGRCPGVVRPASSGASRQGSASPGPHARGLTRSGLCPCEGEKRDLALVDVPRTNQSHAHDDAPALGPLRPRGIAWSGPTDHAQPGSKSRDLVSPVISETKGGFVPVTAVLPRGRALQTT
jgi:hypothetical protein